MHSKEFDFPGLAQAGRQARKAAGDRCGRPPRIGFVPHISRPIRSWLCAVRMKVDRVRLASWAMAPRRLTGSVPASGVPAVLVGYRGCSLYTQRGCGMQGWAGLWRRRAWLPLLQCLAAWRGASFSCGEKMIKVTVIALLEFVVGLLVLSLYALLEFHELIWCLARTAPQSTDDVATSICIHPLQHVICTRLPPVANNSTPQHSTI